ncbi:winged helix-turn-helix domain-containing protein [Nitratireductor basaltis]|uniref:Cytoplasmic protein n=1 Tax=Nitratireductor basaltis TaxID=472175 RepID=A0A084UBR8_9HYPH|nr:winged helix-turn-helix domain-containing protein [Nitratireductor basaltis]KFB10404.1 hypothetical protein EL18_01436 [Nitratireductor basaltis]
MQTLTNLQARRIALLAQGFGDPEPKEVGRAQLLKTLRRIGLFQIDSVNVAVRAHYMPLYSRMGAYRQELLERVSGRRPRGAFEYWAHEASLLPVEDQPLFRWRMERARRGVGIYSGLARFGREKQAFIRSVLDRVADDGPLTCSAIEGHKGQAGWWEWSDAKRALEWLFWAGLVTTHSRGANFERVYDLPERVLPERVLDAPTPHEADAQRMLVANAARALGIATQSDLRDYYRLAPADAYPRINELVEDGVLEPVAVRGWRNIAYLHRDARKPRPVRASALLAPFDPLIWERTRAERIFGFRYRIEIYTPAHKRQHGYYVYPFLLGEKLAARVDLKADRKAGMLLVQNATLEEAQASGETAHALAARLSNMASWLGLNGVIVRSEGYFSADVTRSLSQT